MATVIDRPPRGLDLLLRDSTAGALAIAGIGVTALAAVLMGPLLVVWNRGFTPVGSLIKGLESDAVTGFLIFGLVLGVVGSVAGWGTYRRMRTKVSREEAVAGAVLGLQAVAIAGVLLWFVSGDVDLFTRNYFDFAAVGPRLHLFFKAAWNTLALALTGEAIGIVLGLLLAVFAISKRAVVRAPARSYINLFRGTPLIWQMLFIGTAIPLGLQINIDLVPMFEESYEAAILALGLNAGAYSAEVFRAGIQSVQRGQLEAARGLGMSYGQAMRHAVLPQAVRTVIPPLMNEFVILIKDTSLVIVLGLTAAERDLMSVGNAAVANTANATFLVITAIGYLAVSLPLIRLVNAVERRLRSGLVGVGA